MYKQLCFFWMVMIIATTTKAQTNLPIKFYNHPVINNTEAGQSTFKSSEFIYGRVELGTTVKKYFKIQELTEKLPYSYVIYNLIINYTNKWGEKKQIENYGKYALLKEDQLEKNYLNIDVLPNPLVSTWVLSGTFDFSSVLSASPFYNMINADVFNKNGDVSVSIMISNSSKDAWGNDEPAEKRPSVKGNFIFNFNEADIAQLEKNKKQANQLAEDNAVKVAALPSVFSKSDKFTDPELSSSTAFTIIKRDLPELIIKKSALQNRGGWRIINGNNGIPRYKTYNAELHVAYKQNGKCYISEIIFFKSYLGGGKYSKIMAESSQEKMIDCAAIK